jgi:ABC-type multidrug transport system ATPase subunit
VPPTAGAIRYFVDEAVIPAIDVFKYVSIAAPYMDLIEEFTLDEIVRFHFKFKKSKVQDVIEHAELTHARSKKIGAFSSGMKQRLKLALAFYSDTPLLFLDEPTTNLDKHAIAWYKDNLGRQTGRTIVIASNQEDEYPLNSSKIDLSAYKGAVTKPPQ